MKRIFDIAFSLVGIMILWPLIAMAAVAVKLGSSGPVIFKQIRLTQGMKEFSIYKFRTMKTDFDKDARGIQISASSQAITPLGRILRKSKIDELPQLFNILRGDMSFVGPRPELPRRLRLYSNEDKLIFSVKSGITSPASIVFSDEERLMDTVNDPEKFYLAYVMPYKIALNSYYIQRRSFFYDFKLICATLINLFYRIDPKFVLLDQKLVSHKAKIIEAARTAINV